MERRIEALISKIDTKVNRALKINVTIPILFTFSWIRATKDWSYTTSVTKEFCSNSRLISRILSGSAYSAFRLKSMVFCRGLVPMKVTKSSPISLLNFSAATSFDTKRTDFTKLATERVFCNCSMSAFLASSFIKTVTVTCSLK